MAEAIPKWVMNRYAKVWNKFKDKTFSYEQIEKVLKIDDKRVISVFISELKKAGWITIQLNKEDTRKREYQLKSPMMIVGEIGKQNDAEKNNTRTKR